MEIRTSDHNGVTIGEVDTGAGAISTVADVLDLMAELYTLNTSHLVLAEAHFDPTFYDLRTGLAGEILQKFANYSVLIAIVGEFSAYASNNRAGDVGAGSSHCPGCAHRRTLRPNQSRAGDHR